MTAVLSLGSINADFQVRVERPPEGPGTLLAHDLLRTSGGKGANVGVLARRLGTEARLLGCVGDDDLAEQALAGPIQAGVDISLVRRATGPTGLSNILVTPDGDKAIVLALNANDAWAHDAELVGSHVAEATESILVADLEVPIAVVRAALHAAREANMVVVLDPAPAGRMPDDLLPLVDHVTPDHLEAGEMTGLDAGDDNGAFCAAAALRKRGAGAAYVKLSSGGCAVASSEGCQVIHGPVDLDVVDTTGAGDAFAGALAWALLAGRSPLDAAGIAVAASSCAVTTYGSQQSYPSPAQLDAMAVRVADANR